MRQEYIQYQNANQSFEEVAENFVVRRKEFERVMAEIRNYDGYSSFQHTVFVGRRGSGKSTILRRIQAELSMDKALNERYEVVRLAEEQTFIYKLYDLWDYVIREMNVLGYAIQIPDFRDYRDDMKQFSKILHELITDQLKKKKKQLILLLDNIDRILSLGNHHEEASLLRELLINFKEIRIIGGSTVMSEHFWKYDKPFYQFFSIKMLEPLTNQEIKALFNHWSEKRKLPEIKNIMEKSPGKLQSIRMLTDGMPRTMSLFVDILLNQSVNNGYQYLQFIVDKATPIYQERLALISEAQKKVFSELAFFWDAASVEDLIPKCNMEGKLISAILKQLTDIKYVEKIKGKTKNNLYRVEERFFNLWFNMTQGGLQHRAIAKALSDFLESWYDATELNSYCSNFSLHISHDKVSQEYTMAMSHALMSSKFIKWDIKRNFYKNLEKSNTINKEDLNDLKSYFSDIDVEIDTAFEQGDYRKAIELLHLS
ncbi:MAG: AAA family ATPase, partial [Saprospiraceae bacterium]|nr:AAA family ATPase [Saprospiraceae bacterium]